MKGNYMFIFLFFKKILAYLVRLPLFLYHLIIDIFKYIKNKGYKEFNKFGLHIWVAKFGGGKTSSMVRTAYNLCKRYPQVTLLTNIKLSNFPEHTKILELHTVDDILKAPQDTIVLIDEIGTLFNSRDFRNGDALPKVLFQHLCQCRHRRMVIFGTVQRWQFLDKQLRDITTTVHSCHTFFSHPFSRITSETVYDAFEYERVYNNPTLTLHPLSCSVHIQSDKLRSLYDTMELVDTMLKMQYDDDNTILANQGYSVGVGVPLEKSDRHRVQRNNKRVG